MKLFNRDSMSLPLSPGEMPIQESSHPLDIEYIKTDIPCQWACPVLTSIPEYIGAIHQGRPGDAYVLNQHTNLLPGVLGRICSRPCEGACRHADPDLGEAVSICHLKRAAGDLKSADYLMAEEMFARTGKTVGVVGAGPAGLAVAHFLSLFGHKVTVYEGMKKPGGMLTYGIPEFRLSRAVIDEEVANLLQRGISLELNVWLGRDIFVDDLLRRHHAVVVATGCFEGRKLPHPGEGKPGVYSGLEFMMEINQGNFPSVGERVVVIGGGFTAVDCARTSLRLGAKEVFIAIRSVEEQLYLTKETIRETKREGIKFLSLVSSCDVVGDDVTRGVIFKRNRFGGVRGSGGKTVEPIEGSDFVMPVDTVIAAIGQQAQSQPYRRTSGEIPKFDRTHGTTAQPGLFAAGDLVKGPTTVIEAIAHSRQVASTVDTYLMNRTRTKKVVSIAPAQDTPRQRAWDLIPRLAMPTLPAAARLASPAIEVEIGYQPEQIIEESKRCYLCNLKYEIDLTGCIFCRWCIEICPRGCIELAKEIKCHPADPRGRIVSTDRWNEVAGVVINSHRCIRCGACRRICPTRCIQVKEVSIDEKLIKGGERP